MTEVRSALDVRTTTIGLLVGFVLLVVLGVVTVLVPAVSTETADASPSPIAQE